MLLEVHRWWNLMETAHILSQHTLIWENSDLWKSAMGLPNCQKVRPCEMLKMTFTHQITTGSCLHLQPEICSAWNTALSFEAFYSTAIIHPSTAIIYTRLLSAYYLRVQCQIQTGGPHPEKHFPLL